MGCEPAGAAARAPGGAAGGGHRDQPANHRRAGRRRPGCASLGGRLGGGAAFGRAAWPLRPHAARRAGRPLYRGRQPAPHQEIRRARGPGRPRGSGLSRRPRGPAPGGAQLSAQPDRQPGLPHPRRRHAGGAGIPFS